MCGIAGFAIAPQSPVIADKLDALQCMAESLILGIKDRGSDATGIAIMVDKKVKVYKKPIKAEDFVKRTFFQKFIKENIVPGIKGVLLHTRAQTKGSPSDNRNNHPIIFGTVVGVHNGIIMNDDYFMRKIGYLKNGEVDSQAIFAGLHKHVSEEKHPGGMSMSDAMRKVDTALSGSMAIAAYSTLVDDNILLFKNRSPLSFREDTKNAMLVFASSKEVIAQAYEQSGLESDNSIDDVMDGCIIRADICNSTVKAIRSWAGTYSNYGSNGQEEYCHYI